LSARWCMSSVWHAPSFASLRSVRTAAGVVRAALVAGLCVGASSGAFGGARGLGAPTLLGVQSRQGATTWAVAPFVVELVGPLQVVRLEHDAATRALLGLPPFVVELEVSLAPGERRRVVAPTLLADPRGVALGAVNVLEVVATVPAGAEAQVEVSAPPRAQSVVSTPSARAARLVPPADDSPRRAPGLALVCLAVALPVVLARGALGPGRAASGDVQGHGRARENLTRRLGRVLFAVLVTLVVAAGAVAIDVRQGGGAGGESAQWTTDGHGGVVVLRAPRCALRLEDDGRVVRVDAWTRAASVRAPGEGLEGGSLAVTLDLSGVAAAGAAPVSLRCSGDGVWLLVAERGTWLVERELSAGARLLVPEVNTWGACADVWVRELDGAWGRRGPWEHGAGLPEALADGVGSAPPGWLAEGLPQGVRVLVARLAAGTWAGPSAAPGAPLRGGPSGRPEAADAEVWLRRTDF
jgi:hypothetical protein